MPSTTIKKVTAPKKGASAAKTAIRNVTSKKAPTKAVAAPKKVTKKAVVKGLVCAPEHECFWTTDGQILKNLEDLALAFASMHETVFLYHANEDKNDFANWVEHVLADSKTAAELRTATTPKKAATIAKKHLRRHSS